MGENPARRMFKVSMAMSVNHGLVGPKLRLKGVDDGQQVNIPVLAIRCEGVRLLKRQASSWL